MLPLQAEGTYTIIGVFVLLLVAGSTGYWVYIDGSNRGVDRAPWWGVGIFWLLVLGVIPGLIALGVYLSKRPARPD
jgi:H+/Cl- antiporter ClcA